MEIIILILKKQIDIIKSNNKIKYPLNDEEDLFEDEDKDEDEDIFNNINLLLNYI